MEMENLLVSSLNNINQVMVGLMKEFILQQMGRKWTLVHDPNY